MMGNQVVAYVGAELKPGFRTPVGADKIVKSWRRDQQSAEAEKRRMEQEYDDAIVQIE